MKKEIITLLVACAALFATATNVWARGSSQRRENTTDTAVERNSTPTFARVIIEGSGRRWVYPLDAEVTLSVPGPLGNTVIRIHGNQTWVESSPCDNQICVAAGKLYRNFDFAACLPNSVMMIVEGDLPSDVDGAAR